MTPGPPTAALADRVYVTFYTFEFQTVPEHGLEDYWTDRGCDTSPRSELENRPVRNFDQQRDRPNEEQGDSCLLPDR